MLKNIIIILVVFLNVSCYSNKFGLGFYNGNYSTEVPPPGTVKISENLFVDENEISNIDYKEFMYWVEKVYGKESEQFNQTIPDTNVWAEQNFIPHLNVNYLRHPSYDMYPVVGISYEQADIYTNWRNDRIAEFILYSLDLILLDTFPTPKNHFTIERYSNKNYYKTKKYEDVLLPIYRIPNKNEWENFARSNSNYQFGTDSLSRKNRRIIKTQGHLYCTKEFVESDKNKLTENRILELTVSSFRFSRNEFNLHGIIGNVAEIVSNKNISKGGSWKDSINDISIKKDNNFENVNCWTGFRNICEWKKVKSITRPNKVQNVHSR